MFNVSTIWLVYIGIHKNISEFVSYKSASNILQARSRYYTIEHTHTHSAFFLISGANQLYFLYTHNK